MMVGILFEQELASEGSYHEVKPRFDCVITRAVSAVDKGRGFDGNHAHTVFSVPEQNVSVQ